MGFEFASKLLSNERLVKEKGLVGLLVTRGKKAISFHCYLNSNKNK